MSYTDSTPLTSGSYMGLRTINTRARFDDVQANEMALSYLHGDHLGSNSLMTDAAGTIIPNSQAAYLPFGDWRNEPSTADLTDVGYTGHKHNNTASNDLGLIYMNARYYLLGTGRFVSADTIVPNLTSPQDFNRFSYVLNNPIHFTDPTGHCVEENNDECWRYLQTEFCMNGLLCESYVEWIIPGGNTWTIEELDLVRRGILATRNALIRIGIEDWKGFIGDTRFRRERIWKEDANAEASSSGTITIYNGTFILARDLDIVGRPRDRFRDDDLRATHDILFTIVHELGHQVDFNHGKLLRDLYYNLSNGENGLIGEGYFLREYGDTRSPVEGWADAFASWVLGLQYHTSGGITGFKAAQANDIDWGAIDVAVVTALNQVAEPE